METLTIILLIFVIFCVFCFAVGMMFAARWWSEYYNVSESPSIDKAQPTDCDIDKGMGIEKGIEIEQELPDPVSYRWQQQPSTPAPLTPKPVQADSQGKRIRCSCGSEKVMIMECFKCHQPDIGCMECRKSLSSRCGCSGYSYPHSRHVELEENDERGRLQNDGKIGSKTSVNKWIRSSNPKKEESPTELSGQPNEQDYTLEKTGAISSFVENEDSQCCMTSNTSLGGWHELLRSRTSDNSQMSLQRSSFIQNMNNVMTQSEAISTQNPDATGQLDSNMVKIFLEVEEKPTQPSSSVTEETPLRDQEQKEHFMPSKMEREFQQIVRRPIETKTMQPLKMKTFPEDMMKEPSLRVEREVSQVTQPTISDTTKKPWQPLPNMLQEARQVTNQDVVTVPQPVQCSCDGQIEDMKQKLEISMNKVVQLADALNSQQDQRIQVINGIKKVAISEGNGMKCPCGKGILQKMKCVSCQQPAIGCSECHRCLSACGCDEGPPSRDSDSGVYEAQLAKKSEAVCSAKHPSATDTTYHRVKGPDIPKTRCQYLDRNTFLRECKRIKQMIYNTPKAQLDQEAQIMKCLDSLALNRASLQTMQRPNSPTLDGVTTDQLGCELELLEQRIALRKARKMRRNGPC